MEGGDRGPVGETFLALCNGFEPSSVPKHLGVLTALPILPAGTADKQHNPLRSLSPSDVRTQRLPTRHHKRYGSQQLPQFSNVNSSSLLCLVSEPPHFKG